MANVAKGFQGDVGPDTRGGRMKREAVSLNKRLCYEQERQSGDCGKAWIQGPYFQTGVLCFYFYENSKGEDEDEGKGLKRNRITSR